MLKSLYPDVEWEGVRAVGFDMDGTLYDEMDFIVQVYRRIAQQLAAACGTDEGGVLEGLLAKWLEKGSSYPFIFEEVLLEQGVEESRRQATVSECLALFRSFQPQLHLSERVRYLLSYFKGAYPIFLATDGRPVLQQAKFDALRLGRWFEKDNVAISGLLGNRYYKPSTAMLDQIVVLQSGVATHEVVFFGDRACDRDFAAQAGFQFVAVRCMHPSPIRA